MLLLVLLVLAVLIWLVFYLLGNDTHATNASIFFGLVAAEALVIGLPSRKSSPQAIWRLGVYVPKLSESGAISHR
jgi:hypothetical protein